MDEHTHVLPKHTHTQLGCSHR